MVEGRLSASARREGAILHRFGVDRDGVMVWGRVKEKAAAAAQYQANVYEGSTEDPALLEWDAPGVYRARLYPIGPGESRRVVVRYAEWLGRTGAARRAPALRVSDGRGGRGGIAAAHRGAEGTLRSRQGAARKEVRVGMAGRAKGIRIVVRAQDHVPRADLAVELFDDGPGEPRALPAPPRAGSRRAATAATRRCARKWPREEADYVLVPVRAEQVPLAAAAGSIWRSSIDTSAATEPAALAIARAATAACSRISATPIARRCWAGDDELRPVVADRNGARQGRRAGAARVLAGAG